MNPHYFLYYINGYSDKTFGDENWVNGTPINQVHSGG